MKDLKIVMNLNCLVSRFLCVTIWQSQNSLYGPEIRLVI
jgi:hypothetical protein